MERMVQMCIKLSVLSFQFVDDEIGMSFNLESIWPQASEMCCDIAHRLGKDIPRLSFRFSLHGGDSGEGLAVRK